MTAVTEAVAPSDAAAQERLKELLVAGVHFGHQTRRWNPKMRPYIFGEMGGIHVIDLDLTALMLQAAIDFCRDLASRGEAILFAGTKKQARDTVREVADSCDMPYVNHRWLGGLLTNYQTISKRIDRLHELVGLKEQGQLDLLPVRERMAMEDELERLVMNLGGVRDMKRLPGAIVIVDLKAEEIAVKEARRLGIPIVGIVDTNCDPDPVDYVIPGNDDAIRSCEVILKALGKAVAEGREGYLLVEKARKEAEEKARREAEERARQEAEERARRDAEEKARKEAEEKARRESVEKAKAGVAAEAAPAEQRSTEPGSVQPVAPSTEGRSVDTSGSEGQDGD